MIVRRDLPPGILAANLIHAAGESSPGNLPPNTRAVALTCPSEDQLRALAGRLGTAGVPFSSIVETEGAHAGQLMAVGIPPGRKEELRRHLSSLPLLK